ncbi:hypothetical protein ACWCP6_05290 [Streptomyces sp. NPDC002004]
MDVRTTAGRQRRTPGTGFPSARTRQGSAGSGGALFAMTRAWAAGILVLLVSEYVQMRAVYDTLVGPRGPQSFGGALLLVHLPNLLCLMLTTWAAARAHPEEQRELRVRHAAAAFGVPVAAQVLTLTVSWDRPGFGALAVGMSTAVLLAGCGLGWLLSAWQESRSG